MTEKPSRITQTDLERELADMTAPSNDTPELWREALEQSRSGNQRGTRRIPGRRRISTSRLAIVELCVVVAVIGIGIAIYVPAIGGARSLTPSSSQRSEAFAPSMPTGDRAVDSTPNLLSLEVDDIVHDLSPGRAQRQPNQYASAIESKVHADYAAMESAPAAAGLAAADADGGRAAARAVTAQDAQPAATPDQRLIATTLWISLIVPDAEAALRACEDMLDLSRGEFIEQSQIRGAAGNRSGELTLRVITDRQGSVIGAIRQLGEVESEQQRAEDLTASIIDSDARLRTLRQVESELGNLLERRENDTLADIVTAQRELGTTRGEIESLEARLRVQQQRVRLTTITVSLRERFDPTPDSLPSYGRTAVTAGRDALTLVDRMFYRTVVSSPIWLGGLLAWVGWRVWRHRRSVGK